MAKTERANRLNAHKLTSWSLMIMNQNIPEKSLKSYEQYRVSMHGFMAISESTKTRVFFANEGNLVFVDL